MKVTSDQICKWIKSKDKRLQRQAIKYIFDKLKNPVEKLAFHFKLDKVDVADAMQESVKSIWNRLYVKEQDFDDEKGGVFAYAYVVCRNFLIKRAKERSIELPTAPLTSDYEQDIMSPFHRIAEDDQIEDERIYKKELLITFIRKLDKEKDGLNGKIFVLRVIHDLKTKQIAKKLNLKEATVRKRLSRLKKKIRESLGDVVDDIL